MAVASKRGNTGVVRRSELRSLLRCANASAALSVAMIEETLQLVKQAEDELELPRWLRVAPLRASSGAALLNAQHVTGLLIRLSTSSQHINDLFHSDAVNGRIELTAWLSFVQQSQLAVCGQEDEDRSPPLPSGSDEMELAKARVYFEWMCATAGGDPLPESSLGLLQFSQLLLSTQTNNASSAVRERDTTDDLHKPLAQYWMDSSHNSCTAMPLELKLLAFVHFAPRDFASHRCRLRRRPADRPELSGHVPSSAADRQPPSRNRLLGPKTTNRSLRTATPRARQSASIRWQRQSAIARLPRHI
jgi:hypothetical protein|eukprot:4973183-Prymnesium_polylepis.2